MGSASPDQYCQDKEGACHRPMQTDAGRSRPKNAYDMMDNAIFLYTSAVSLF
jgi:hypothetical protein